MALTQTRTHAGPAQLSGIGLQIESRDTGHIMIQSLTHRLTPAGVVAVLGVANTYLSGLGATAQTALINQSGGVSVTPGSVRFPCQPADVVTVAGNLSTALLAAGNTVRG